MANRSPFHPPESRPSPTSLHDHGTPPTTLSAPCPHVPARASTVCRYRHADGPSSIPHYPVELVPSTRPFPRPTLCTATTHAVACPTTPEHAPSRCRRTDPPTRAAPVARAAHSRTESASSGGRIGTRREQPGQRGYLTAHTRIRDGGSRRALNWETDGTPELQPGQRGYSVVRIHAAA